MVVGIVDEEVAARVARLLILMIIMVQRAETDANLARIFGNFSWRG